MNIFENIITCVKNNTLKPTNVFQYVDFIEEKTQLPELKSEIRDLSINNILGKIGDDDFTTEKEKIIADSSNYSNSISTKIVSQNINSLYYKNAEDLNDIVFKYLVNISNIPHPHKNFDINSNQSQTTTLSRLVTTRIITLSSFIAAVGRRGPANTLVVGSDILLMLDGLDCGLTAKNPSGAIGIIGGLNTFYNPHLKSNRLILLRRESTIETGINLVWGDNNLYCIFNTGQFWKQVLWFDVI